MPETALRSTRLGARLSLIVFAFLVAGFGAVIAVDIWKGRTLSISAAREQSLELTRVLAGQLGGAVRFRKPEQIELALASLVAKRGDRVRRIEVRTAEGETVYPVPAGGGAAEPLPAGLADVLSRAAAGSAAVAGGSGVHFQTAAPVTFGPENQVNGYLAVDWDGSWIDRESLRTAIQSGSVALVALIVVASVLLLAIRRIVTQPLTALTEAMQRIRDGRLDIAIDGTGRGDEIGAMARTLGDFRDGLQQARALSEAAARQQKEQERVVGDLRGALSRLAAGDLTAAIPSPAAAPFPADYEGLRQDFNTSVARLGGIVGSLSASASALRDLSTEINGAATALSGRTESQAATLEQSAAALETILNSVRGTAERTGQAERSMLENRARASSSRVVVTEAIEAMRAIEKASGQISQVIGVIDDIAFQTNLLALNAGVEAARAGEAGRGFSVVASEVRSLAQRASGSAREIGRLIQESGRQVENGSAAVSRAGVALEDIIGGVSEVGHLIEEIAEGARAQSTSLAELNDGMTQLDGMTQKNAAIAEEVTASAAVLLAEAETLSDSLAGLRLAEGGAAGPAAAAA